MSVSSGKDRTEEERRVRRRIERHPVQGSVERMRAAFAQLADLPIDTAGVRLATRELHGLETLGVTPDTGRTAPEGRCDTAPIVHLHGGGYVFGSAITHARMAVQLARSSGRTVLLPEYPLAPEHSWPAQRTAVLDWLRNLDAGPGLILSGDSAGGHLALCLALTLGTKRQPRLAGLTLFSPNTLRDYARSESRTGNAERDAMNDPEQDDALARLAFGSADVGEQERNPLDADLASLPPLLIEVGGDEVLLDDSLLLARRAALAGVDVRLQVSAGVFHMSQLFAQHWSIADRSLQRAGDWVRAAIDDQPG